MQLLKKLLTWLQLSRPSLPRQNLGTQLGSRGLLMHLQQKLLLWMCPLA